MVEGTTVLVQDRSTSSSNEHGSGSNVGVGSRVGLLAVVEASQHLSRGFHQVLPLSSGEQLGHLTAELRDLAVGLLHVASGNNRVGLHLLQLPEEVEIAAHANHHQEEEGDNSRATHLQLVIDVTEESGQVLYQLRLDEVDGTGVTRVSSPHRLRTGLSPDSQVDVQSVEQSLKQSPQHGVGVGVDAGGDLLGVEVNVGFAEPQVFTRNAVGVERRGSWLRLGPPAPAPA